MTGQQRNTNTQCQTQHLTEVDIGQKGPIALKLNGIEGWIQFQLGRCEQD
jgi:hypothetical protein